MSVTYLLLIFLCISLHACNARLLTTIDKKLKKKTHFSIKNNENNGLDSYPEKLGMRNGDNEKQLQKPKEKRSVGQRVTIVKGKASGALKTESLVSVSWTVPHKKHGETNPAFNLDYSPPKTHPPSHN